MSPKYADMEDKERRSLQNDVYAKGAPVGDEWEGVSRRVEFNGVGVCGDCKYLEGFKTQYGTIRARCSCYKVRLDGQDPILDCTEYVKRGEMSLQDMWAIAWIVDPPQRKVGF